jgi:hypothetical protein
MNNVSGIPSDIIGYIETSYDKLLLELYYTYRTEAVSVIMVQYPSPLQVFSRNILQELDMVYL